MSFHFDDVFYLEADESCEYDRVLIVEDNSSQILGKLTVKDS